MCQWIDVCSFSRRSSELIEEVKRTQTALKKEGSICFHEIASNDPEVLNSFEKEDFCKEILSLNLEKDAIPVHQNFGLSWNLESDSFIFNIQVVKNLVQKKDSRQCLIVYDPLGFVAPILINGKILLREITTSVGWDIMVAG